MLEKLFKKAERSHAGESRRHLTLLAVPECSRGDLIHASEALHTLFESNRRQTSTSLEDRIDDILRRLHQPFEHILKVAQNDLHETQFKYTEQIAALNHDHSRRMEALQASLREIRSIYRAQYEKELDAMSGSMARLESYHVKSYEEREQKKEAAVSTIAELRDALSILRAQSKQQQLDLQRECDRARLEVRRLENRMHHIKGASSKEESKWESYEASISELDDQHKKAIEETKEGLKNLLEIQKMALKSLRQGHAADLSRLKEENTNDKEHLIQKHNEERCEWESDLCCLLQKLHEIHAEEAQRLIQAQAEGEVEFQEVLRGKQSSMIYERGGRKSI